MVQKRHYINGKYSRNANLGDDYVFRSRFSYYMVVYLAMRYTYKVREIGKEEVKDMYAMSLKKLKGQLDHKKEYAVEYTNKHDNFISTTLRGKEPK
jgi:hypothetical protein